MRCLEVQGMLAHLLNFAPFTQLRLQPHSTAICRVRVLAVELPGVSLQDAGRQLALSHVFRKVCRLETYLLIESQC